MAHSHLATYLNDHLAGSVTALELLTNIAETFADSDVERLALELHAEIAADRVQLEALMERLHISKSGPRKASAWLAEKAVQLKLRLGDPASGPLRLLESTEAVSAGIGAKQMLWLALSAAAMQEPKLLGPDYEDLIRRAEDQRHRLETVRLEAARAALTVES